MENTMKERLLEILEELDPEVDYESCTFKYSVYRFRSSSKDIFLI